MRSSQEAFIFTLSCKPMNITVEHYSWFQMQQNKFDINDQELSCFSLTNSAEPKWNKRPYSIIKLKRDRTSKEYCQITHIQRWFLSLYNMVQIIHIKIHSLTHLILQTSYQKYPPNGSSMLRTPLHRTVYEVFYSHCMQALEFSTLSFKIHFEQGAVCGFTKTVSLESECLRWVRFMELMRGWLEWASVYVRKKL